MLGHSYRSGVAPIYHGAFTSSLLMGVDARILAGCALLSIIAGYVSPLFFLPAIVLFVVGRILGKVSPYILDDIGDYLEARFFSWNGVLPDDSYPNDRVPSYLLSRRGRRANMHGVLVPTAAAMSTKSVWGFYLLNATFVGGALLRAFTEMPLEKTIEREHKRFKNSHADKLMYRQLVRPNVLALANGGYLACFDIAAPDASSFDDRSVSQMSEYIALAISRFDDRMVVHFHQRHERYSEYDMRVTEYPTAFGQFLDKRRQSYFLSDNTFRSRRVVSIAWIPLSENSENLRRLSSVGGDAKVRSEDDDIAQFEDHLSNIVEQFEQVCQVDRLGEVTYRDEQGELRTYSIVA